MRYFIVGDVVYSGSEVALWQIMNTGAPVMEISAEKFAEHKAAYDEFWAPCNFDEMDLADQEYEDLQFYQSGLLLIGEAPEDDTQGPWVREWTYHPKDGLARVSYQSIAA